MSLSLTTLPALEFERIVDVITGLAVTPTGHDRLAELQPHSDSAVVRAALKATSEGTRFLASRHGFPLRAPADLHEIIDALGVEGRALEPLRLTSLAEYLESIEQSRNAVRQSGGSFPMLETLVDAVASFRSEAADVRRKIDGAGEVADHATPTLASIRDRLRKQRARLRSTLEGFLRGRDTAKYLQDQVVTDRNGRYVLLVRAEHRSAIPGIVHGASASGASLFLEPLGTVDINNDIVALEQQEAEEVRRILLALTDAFRARAGDLERTLHVATELDVIQARARLSQLMGGIEPQISTDGTFELLGARHPLLMPRVNERLEEGREGGGEPVPVDLRLVPPIRILVITGPNTGGKTVALKTAGLLAAMTQAGLHIPVEKGSRLPVFKSIFADIGDEQSIAASLSTFSAHITNVVSMDHDLELPALVLLDEVGAGTDPVEGGALGIAVIDHFRRRGAHLFATTHYDALKSYAATTDEVVCAAFGFDPETFAPTYQLLYGSPGRSLAIEIAARLGMPPSVIATARENLTEGEKQLAEHLARVDEDIRLLEKERRQVQQDRETLLAANTRVKAREDSLEEREEALRRRVGAKVDEQVREARREIDRVMDGLKARAAELYEQAVRETIPGPRLMRPRLTTGDTGAVRAEARTAIDRAVSHLREAATAGSGEAPAEPAPPLTLEPGARVIVGTLGIEGSIIQTHDAHAEVDVRGKRMRVALRDLQAVAGPRPSPHVSVNISLQPREGSLSELNVIGCTVDEALTRAGKFIDASVASDQQSIRIIHGHGTGQLRRAVAQFLKEHPLVARFEAAPQDAGGAAVTVVELKD